jgi:hypothetical protein
MTIYENWILIIGIATFLVALATFLYVLFEKRIKIKVELLITDANPPLTGSSPPVLLTQQRSHLGLQAHVHNNGIESFFYRSYYVYVGKSRVNIEPLVSPRINAEEVGPHQRTTFTFSVSNKKDEIAELIKSKEKTHLKFGVILHDGRERMSNSILVLIKHE